MPQSLFLYLLSQQTHAAICSHVGTTQVANIELVEFMNADLTEMATPE